MQSVSSSGGDATGQNGFVSYSIGQVFINTPGGINGTLQKGVQQPFEIIIMPGIKVVKDIDLLLSAYPNPVSKSLTLKIMNQNIRNFKYQLYDLDGRMLKAMKIAGSETFVPMEGYPPSSYYLRVTEGNNEIKSFKIIKSN